MGNIQIANRLSIRHGNKIAVPGNEPLSEFTSNTLSQNLVINNIYVDLADALNAIPGSYVDFAFFSGMKTQNEVDTGRYFILPDGPPSKFGCIDCTSTDWYQILRNIPKRRATPPSPKECDTFKWGGCAFDQLI